MYMGSETTNCLKVLKFRTQNILILNIILILKLFAYSSVVTTTKDVARKKIVL